METSTLQTRIIVNKMDKKKKELRSKSKSLDPSVQIGKSGLSESIIKEVKKQLDQKDMIKIKLLRSAIEDSDKKKIAEELAKKTGAELIDQIGFTLVLKKVRKSK